MTPNERLRIRARSGVADETLQKFLDDPTSVREASRIRIERAANDEGIEIPCVTARPAKRARRSAA